MKSVQIYEISEQKPEVRIHLNGRDLVHLKMKSWLTCPNQILDRLVLTH